MKAEDRFQNVAMGIFLVLMIFLGGLFIKRTTEAEGASTGNRHLRILDYFTNNSHGGDYGRISGTKSAMSNLKSALVSYKCDLGILVSSQ